MPHPRIRFRTVLRGALRYIFGRRGQRRVHGLRLYYKLRTKALLHTDDPWQEAVTRTREVRLWVDGEEAFARLEKLLRRARHTIVIQMFIWKDDRTGRRIASILLDAADRGVDVHITKEAVGDFFEYTGGIAGTKSDPSTLWQRFWTHARIHIEHATLHDHAKVYIIDDQILMLTGMNIADEYRERWHDYLVELRGSRFVTQYLMRGEPGLVAPSHRTDAGTVRLIMNTPMRKDIRGAVTTLLSSARRSITLEQCYLADPAIIDLLIGISRKDVHITIIISEAPGFHRHANEQAVGRLLTEGAPGSVRVFLYPGIVHAKVILVDRTKMFLGSANLITSSLDQMGEVCVLIEGRYRLVLLKLREALRRDIFLSKPLTSPRQLWWVGRWLAGLGL